MRFWISPKEYRPIPGQLVRVLVDTSRVVKVCSRARVQDRKTWKWHTVTVEYELVNEDSMRVINAIYDEERDCYYSQLDGSLLENVVAWTRDDFNSQIAKRLKLSDVCPMPESWKAILLNKAKEPSIV